MYECQSAAETLSALKTDRNGLTAEEACGRCQIYGQNVLEEEKKKSMSVMFLEQLNEPLIFVLFVAAAVSMVLREFGDTAIIFAVIFINASAGVIQEGKAQKAMEALKKMTAPSALVRRSGNVTEIKASQLVPGDIVLLEAGRTVPADLRLIQTTSLKADESSLTGESMPVDKDAAFEASKKTGIGDCKNMAFMSTTITYGRGEGVVTATGMSTQIGKIAGMIQSASNEMTPLQKRLAELGKILSIVAVFLCAALFAIAVIQHRNVPEMLITAISLAVAAVPEGLPAVVTIVLALSVSRMVKVNTIVRRLPCVETLGCVSVVCSDKTGTLTQNQMTVRQCYTDMQLRPVSGLNKVRDELFIEGFCLCNDAVLKEDGQGIGDPTELALLAMGKTCGYHKEAFEQMNPRVDELPFDSARKMMSTLHKNKTGFVQFTKGSCDELLQRCSHVCVGGRACPMTPVHRQDIEQALAVMSRKALRVLALAIKPEADSLCENGLAFVGLAGMEDPARPEAKAAVDTFNKAGIKTVMITGDYPETAFAIAKQLGITDDREKCMSGSRLEMLSDEEFARQVEQVRVFARVSPKHKVRIVKAFKRRGHIVAMTGDGVNDAPSLKAADIGIAMGKNGTDAARSAADIVLTDDKFSTIEKAVEEGRGIYANIKKSVLFLLSSNFGEIMTMFAAILLGIASPLKASHILWINLITDSLPALALGVDQNDTKTMMSHPPRPPKESLFAGGGLMLTCFYGALIAVISLAAFFKVPYTILRYEGMALSMESVTALLAQPHILARAQTYAFTVLGISQLFHAAGMRNIEISIFKMCWFSNKLMLAAFAAGLALQFAVTEVPALIGLFGTVRLDMSEWAGLLFLSAMPVLAHELLVRFVKRNRKMG